MSSQGRVRDASPWRGRIAGLLVMVCGVVVLLSAAYSLHRAHRAVQRDEDILTHFRSEFESASDDTLRQQAEQRGATMMAASTPQYLFHIRRENGPWYCSAVDVNVAVSTQVHAGKRDVLLKKMPVDCL